MKRARGLLIVLLIAAAGIALTLLVHQLTASRAAQEQQDQQRRAFLDILPGGSYDNQPLEHPLAMNPQVLANSQLLGGYLATLSSQPNAVLLHSQVSGYGGPIELLIAISQNGKLLGVKTLKQSETPGLGGHIAEGNNPWLAAFKARSRHDPADAGWALKKDQGQFDQMAGATITSRAVINAVHDALRYFDEQRQSMLEQPARD
ncbi:RnfABCDGE type electron transport complex subunit G [Pseudomonas fluorescens]|uniref:RnfABCDGE type electron transport complex subunit G n=1 Tax=Pseudomonas fluorescens TaxID=294 RepID=UPI001BE6D9F4|nr:RnfABCDGE type electron transport complex subunit G [Pseudomonas fluorescens]MBT2372008.1 RnfABCDGE type electron transport complex subunit G [Pseudomonas fluorescens]